MPNSSRVHWIARLIGAPAWRWHDLGPWRARVRRWWVHTIKRHDAESCDLCGREVDTVYWAPDEDWPFAYEHAMGFAPTQYEWVAWSGLLCEACYIQASYGALGRSLLARLTEQATWSSMKEQYYNV